MDRIEQTVANHISVYTRTPPTNALAGLLTDFMDVRRLCAERQPAMIQARLSEIAALLATLAADSLMKLGRIADSRAWYGTARMAADDSGNRELRARVRAQEAMLPYYYGDPGEAIRLARDAQEILQDVPLATGALAAAAEARALARQGLHSDVLAAITRARDLVTRAGEPDNNEAFRFGERRLLFYESSTFSNLGDSTRAGQAQERALALYGDEPGLIDPTLIRLDQAQLLIHEGDIASACELTQATCTSLVPAHRTLIFAVRIKQIAAALPAGHEARRALSEVHQEITIPNRLEAI
jgi:tetratricopeptide (TPR) repeat protein